MRLTITSTAFILGLSATVALAEGNLNIYNWGEYTSPELIEKFSKTYNVHVTLTDFDSNDTALAKVRQGASGFDVVVPSQSFIPTYIEEGLLAETNPGQMENAKNLEERWRDPAFDPGRKYSVPWLWYTSGISDINLTFSDDDMKVLQQTQDFLSSRKMVPETFRFSDDIDMSFLEEALADNDLPSLAERVK
jgi:spermidine/putrescine transport system substrate-binding protein